MKRLAHLLRSSLLHPVQFGYRLRWLVASAGTGAIWRMARGRTPVTDANWLAQYRLSKKTLETMRARIWPAKAPRFSLFLQIHGVSESRLGDTFESLLSQVYKNWELVCLSSTPLAEDYVRRDPRIRIVPLPEEEVFFKAKGDYVVVMKAGVTLEPQALYRMADAALKESPDLIYGDEAVIGDSPEDVRIQANPSFSYDYFLNHPYFLHFCAVARAVVDNMPARQEPFSLHDFLLRAVLQAKRITHIADLLHRRPRATNSHASLTAVKRHLEQIGLTSVDVRTSDRLGYFTLHHPMPKDSKVAIIIPTKDQPQLVRQCVESVRKTVPSGLADIYVVDHESQQPETHALLEALARTGVRILPHKGPFNFSVINNTAVARLEPGYSHYLFLNNDTEALEPGWLESMNGLAARKDVGAVGALLLYPDRRIQHAGVLLGLGGAADHALRFEAPTTPLAARDHSAVTAACLLVKAEAFNAIGGYDEKLAVGFGDTDLCLRIAGAGYRVLFDPAAKLVHHESVSRGKGDVLDPHFSDTRLFVTRHRAQIDADPFSNPLLDALFYGASLKPGASPQADAPLRTQTVRRPAL